MGFIRDILSGKKKYFLRREIISLKVPTCPELTVANVMQQVKAHQQIMAYLPDFKDGAKNYIERDFLFCVVNTIDQQYFRQALAEIETRRTAKFAQAEDGLIEVDKHLFSLLEQVQSRMSAQKLAASKRTMSALTNVVRERKIVERRMPQPLNIEMRPTPKLENNESARSRAEFMTQSSQMLLSKRKY